MYRDSEERRENPRLFKNLPLQYKKLERFPEIYTSSVNKNLSLGGLCFSSYEFMPLSSRIIISLILEGQKFFRIKAVSRVAWIQKNPLLESYAVGVEFIAMTEEDRYVLGKFISANLS